MIDLRTAPIGCVAGLLLALAAGCEHANSATEKKAPPPVKVEVALPTEKEITDYQDFTGRMDAVDNVEILARVSGYLTKIAFDETIEHGAEVKAGDLLFEIDERPFNIALQSAEAQLAQANAKLTSTTADLARTEELIKKNVSTQANLDHDVAEKLLAAASVKSGEAAVAQAKLDLEFSKITAPISGRISRSLLSIGDLVTPAVGKLTSIVSMEPMQVYFDMDEPTTLAVQALMREGHMKPAQEARLPVLMARVNDVGFPFKGHIDFVENQLDPETGTLRVRGVFDNPKPDRGPRVLAPGMFAKVRVPLGELHKAVLVPERAIGRDQGTPFVYVVNAENEAVYRRVKLGALHEGQREIREGLSATEQVVVNGLQRIRSGVKVDPQTSSTPATK